MKKWILIPCLWGALIILNTVIAWSGDHFALITLAVNGLMLCGFLGVYGYGWRQALDGWQRSTAGWSAAQTWGMQQDLILRDALKDLWEYDEEAVEIHSGRSTNASVTYLRTFNDEDVAYITEGLRDMKGTA